MNAVRIIIIAKEPRPGLAKTRLIPALGAQGAAELADRLLCQTVTQALAAKLGPVELCVTPDRHADYWRPWRDNNRIELTEQCEGDLGKRMATAAQRGLASGLPVMLIGTDCPQLEAPRLKTMAAALMKQDACLCPVLDGGYSLLGLRRFDSLLFSDIPWSTDQVTTLTRDRLRQLGWVWHESEPLWDLDEPDDLARLQHTGRRL
jgi:rSAM/selenodomain-associated transferase 1